MREIRKTSLEHKYTSNLHCNEVMLLPYYIASMNIEHEFYEATGHYLPFEGICLVDTFELAEPQQMVLFTEKNAERVERQKETPMFVVIGNPPYNVGQVNENDNKQKNRKYKTMDKQVRDTYSQDSKATNKKRTLWPLCEGNSVGIRPNWGWRCCRLCDEQRISRWYSLWWDAENISQRISTRFTFWILVGTCVRAWRFSDANVFGIRVGVSINLFCEDKAETHQK